MGTKMKGKQVLQKIKQFVKSKKFLYVLLGVFLLQATFFAVDMDFGVPSDEAYHVGIIQVYVDRPIAAGPVIAQQVDHFELGDIQRFPTYLFHYSLSFVMRATQVFTDSFKAQIVVLRLLNVGFGLLALLVLVRLFRRLGQSQLVVNLVVAWLAVTGMWVWVFSGINYDCLAILLYLITLDQLVALIQKPSVRPVLYSAAAGMALLLTKATYQPIIMISFVGAFIWLLKSAGWSAVLGKLITSWRRDWRSKTGRWVLVAMVTLSILLGGMVLERYGQNYVRYGKATPICDQIHTVEQCKQYAIYDRNSGQKREFETYKRNGGKLFFTPWGFTARWAKMMYERTYFFWGHRAIFASQLSFWVGGLVVISSLVLCITAMLLGFRFQPLETGVLALSAIYIALVFGYNLSVYLNEGYPFAFQGRYLLPALPMVYLVVVQCGLYVVQRARRLERQVLTIGFASFLLISLYLHTPLLIYLRNRQELRIPPNTELLKIEKPLA